MCVHKELSPRQDIIKKGPPGSDIFCALTVLKLGLRCSHPAASERPSMRDVVMYLHGEGGPLEVSKSQPLDHEGGIGMDGFDDLLHSYPSSMEKLEEEEDSFAGLMRRPHPLFHSCLLVEIGEGEKIDN